MMLLILSGILALVFALLGLLAWVALRVFGMRKAGRRVVKVTGVAYLIFLVLFVFGLLPIVTAQMIAHSGTRPQDLRLEVSPIDFGRSFQEVGFHSSDGQSLGGWWLEGEAGQPAFVVTHGLFRDRREVVERACRLNELGFAALVFDLRKHGSSSGETVSMGYQERLDVLAAIRHVAGRGFTRIVPLGVSMGAVATLEAVGEMGPEVVCIIADSPFLSLEETVARHVELFIGVPSFPFVDLFVWNFTRINQFHSSDLDLARSLPNARAIPILLIYGTLDRRMPKETAEAVLNSIPSTEKKLVFFPGASHGEAWKTAPDRYLREISGFVDEHAETGPTAKTAY